MIHRAFRYRLYPTAEQAEKLSQVIGVTRLVYNLALEQRTTFWRQYRALTGRNFTFASQCPEVTELRRQVDWIREVPSVALTQALRDLDKAYAAFFSGRARYPTRRKKGLNDSFRLRGIDVPLKALNRRWFAARIPNLGWVKFRHSRTISGDIQSATISRTALGWFVSFSCEIQHEIAPSDLPAVGIDRGIANTVALSTGELLSTPATLGLEQRKKRAQRILARRQRGSNRYRKQRRRVARISSKIARVRADWRHRTTTDIARRFGVAVLEDLNVANMTASGPGKRGLNRSITAQSWGAFETVLSYKLEERGGAIVKVRPAYTSQECSSCGTIDKASRESQARFACRHCGFAGHADTNAATNILRRSTASMRAEGAGYGPVETRTVNHAFAA